MQGSIEMQGSYCDLLRSGIDYLAAMTEDEEKEDEGDDESETHPKRRRSFSRSSIRVSIPVLFLSITNMIPKNPNPPDRESNCQGNSGKITINDQSCDIC